MEGANSTAADVTSTRTGTPWSALGVVTPASKGVAPLPRPTQPAGKLGNYRECAGRKPSTTARSRKGGHRSERPPRWQLDYRVVVVPPMPQKHTHRRSKKRRSSAKRECERRPGGDSHGDKETGDGRLRRRRRRRWECRKRDRGGRQTRRRRDGSASDPPYLARRARVRGRQRQGRGGGGGRSCEFMHSSATCTWKKRASRDNPVLVDSG